MNRAKALIALMGMALFSAGCAAPPPRRAALPPQAVAAPDRAALVESFMRKVVAGDHEAAFADLDVGTLVNLGRPQGPYYESLPPADQERYRRDFVEGVYASLFRDLLPAQAVFRVAAPDQGSPVVEVTGRPGKVLRLVVQPTSAGLKIVMIERP